MMNLGQLVSTVQKNCHISDARHAGDYSMCIFLLKMREYYRWEHDLPFSCRLPREDIGNWLVEREQEWGRIEDEDYQPVPLGDTNRDPFDAETINQALIELGYVYSSGYGLFNKPHFFLGSLLRREERGGVSILVSSCEYARDLVAPPAMTRDGTIFVRQESAQRFLWEKVEETRFTHQADGPMMRAIACYGGDEDIDRLLSRMTDDEIEIMVAHEFGEVQAGHQLGPDWEALLADMARSKAEFIARAVRDNLADSLVTLPDLLDSGDDGPLHLYFANYGGLRRALLPELQSAYEHWHTAGDTAPLYHATATGRERMAELAGRALDEYRRHGIAARAPIEKMLEAELAPAESAR